MTCAQRWRWSLLVIVLLATLGCSPPDDALVVAAASSLGPLLAEFVPRFERTHRQPVRLSLAGSSTLRAQIEQGAPIDVFLSASSSQVERLVQKGRAHGATDLARNRVVCVASPRVDASSLFHLLRDATRIAVAEPGVPIGDYTRQILDAMGVANSVTPRLVRFPHEQAVLRSVRRGVVDAGWVYASSVGDGPLSVFAVPPEAEAAVVVAGALTSSHPAARAFLDALRGATDLWVARGFLPAELP